MVEQKELLEELGISHVTLYKVIDRLGVKAGKDDWDARVRVYSEEDAEKIREFVRTKVRSYRKKNKVVSYG